MSPQSPMDSLCNGGRMYQPKDLDPGVSTYSEGDQSRSIRTSANTMRPSSQYRRRVFFTFVQSRRTITAVEMEMSTHTTLTISGPLVSLGLAGAEKPDS